jgi:hydrogenase nickel incorporation protein HypB
MLVSKCDLLPYLDFDADALEAYARRVHPDIETLRVSTRREPGLSAWLAWLDRRLAAARRPDTDGAGLERRVDTA